MVLWFAGMEQTFALYTADGFGMSTAATGNIFMVVGIVGAIVQGGLVRRLAPRFGEARLVQAGVVIQGAAFALLGLSADFGAWGVLALYTSAGLIALGNGLTTPSLPAFASRRATVTTQGVTLGALQSASALARAAGPLVGGAAVRDDRSARPLPGGRGRPGRRRRSSPSRGYDPQTAPAG